jgi:uncharacterized membrane protein YjgN (DUF898 family)
MTDSVTPNAGTEPMSSPGVVSVAPENKSDMGRMLWIGFYSSLLMIPTLTLYRFWARTTFRKQLWKDTTLGDEPLEYTGKGMELFIGFIIFIFTIGLPTALYVLGIQLLSDNFALLGVGILVFYVVLGILVAAAIYLARRYMLSRTMWRGVRFWQGGSVWGFIGRAIGFGVLTVLTLGWFAPLMRLKLARYTWGNAFYGDMPFKYDEGNEARTEPVWLSFFVSWLGVAIYYVAIIVATMSFVRPGAIPDVSGLGLFVGVVYGGLILLILFVVWHEAVMLRQITKSISIGDVRLSSRLTAWDILELSISNALLIIFTLGIASMAAQMRVWRRVVKKLSVEGALDLTTIKQAPSRGPKSGEGIADSFDMGFGF